MSKLPRALYVAGLCFAWSLCASASLISENFDATGLAANAKIDGLTLEDLWV